MAQEGYEDGDGNEEDDDEGEEVRAPDTAVCLVVVSQCVWWLVARENLEVVTFDERPVPEIPLLNHVMDNRCFPSETVGSIVCVEVGTSSLAELMPVFFTALNLQCRRRKMKKMNLALLL